MKKILILASSLVLGLAISMQTFALPAVDVSFTADSNVKISKLDQAYAETAIVANQDIKMANTVANVSKCNKLMFASADFEKLSMVVKSVDLKYPLNERMQI